MATFRVGVGSFNIQDGAVGFGTDTDGLGNLKVKGVTKTTDIKVSGASTLTRYSGFAADNINQLENITLTSEVGTIGDIVVGVGTSVIISSASTVTVGTVECLSIGNHFSPPKGGIEERGGNFVEGMMRFNTDLNTMEFYNGSEWRQFTYVSDIQNSPSSRGRGIIAGGQVPGGTNIKSIDSINISSLGNAVNFGDMTNTRRNHGNCSSSTRGLMISGSYSGSPSNNIEYITIPSEGNGIDFGDATASDQGESALASSTRGVHATGNPSNKTMDYVEIATLGNALDFGDRVISLDEHGAVSSATRGLFCGGGAPSGSAPNATMQLITIASKGDAITFGDLTDTRGQLGGGVSDGVRGVVAGGYAGASPYGKKGIDYMTIASTGNAIRFGDLMFTRGEQAGAVCNRVRGIFCGGYAPGAKTNSMEYITIASSGNGQDFGDLTQPKDRIGGGCISDSHGGLGGY